MKRIINLVIIIFVFMFINVINVNAAESKIEKSGNLYKFSWSGVEEYASSMISCSNSTIQDVSNGLSGKYLKGSSGYITINPNKSSTEIVCKINKDDTGSPEITSASITIGSTTTTTATPSTTKQEVTTTTQASKSGNTNLKSLQIKGNDGSNVVLSPLFSSQTYEYETTVESTVKMVEINATLEDAKANMVISSNANKELVAGENNKIVITVTAEDGSVKTYTINVKREALTADATLKELTIEEVKSFKLEKDKFVYNVKINKNIKELTLDYVLSDEKSTLEIEGNENLKNGSKVKITVVAEDGTKKVYTLNIIKEENKSEKVNTSNIQVEKNPLIIMGLSIIAFGLIGGIIYVVKK